jgi:CPA1 family monovalent cation:H+ antiporter
MRAARTVTDDSLHSSVVVAVLVERIKLPYTVGLLLVGLFGLRSGFHDIHLTPGLTLLVFLPGTPLRGRIPRAGEPPAGKRAPITLLAIPGVLISAAATTIIQLALGLPWAIALRFGALVAPTDPIAVSALFRNVGARDGSPSSPRARAFSTMGRPSYCFKSSSP